MSRIRFAAAATVLAMSIAAPVSAIARSHRHHNRGHHATVRHEQFGTPMPLGGSSGSAPGSTEGTTGATGTTGAGAPAPAGTVASFTNGILTLKLADGSMVSGAVTSGTEIECAAPEDNQVQNDIRTDGGGDNNGGGGDQNGGGGDNGPGGGDGGHDGAGNANCPALAPGVGVQDAELAISSTGSTWTRLELLA